MPFNISKGAKLTPSLEKKGVRLPTVNINKYKADQTKKGISTLFALVFIFFNTSLVDEMFLKNKYPERKKNIGTAEINIP